MPTIAVSGDVTFHYTDSGPVDQNIDEYTTVIMIHGHSFHSGIFARILPLAKPHGVRLICVSRRPYQGSTPYTSEEVEIMRDGTMEQRASFLHSQGVLLAHFVDGMIQTHELPKKGGVAIVGWSLGNVFALAVLAAIHDLPPDTKDRLQNYVRSYVGWDAPFSAFGIPQPEGSYMPVWDPNMTPEERDAAFGPWVSGYFQHGDPSLQEYHTLNQRDFDTNARKPTVATMSEDEIRSSTDTTTGVKFDTPIILPGPFETVHRNQAHKALFDPETRKEWPRLKVCMMYCEHTLWVIIYAMWWLKPRAHQGGIDFELITDANHFLMWEDPERFMVSLKGCIFKL